MTIEIGLHVRPVPRSRVTIEYTLLYMGALGSVALLVLTGLQYLGLAHTGVSAYVVDQLVHGEARFNPNGDIHGDWGNAAVAVWCMPAFVGFYGAAAVRLVREYFTGAAD